MINVERIIKIINELGFNTYTFDYSIYNNYIERMYAWYKGYDAKFHRVSEWNGSKDIKYDKYRLNMAKHICEDISTLVCNENLNVFMDNNKEREFLLGYDEMSGILGQNDFWNELAKTFEITCALGTGAFEIVVDDLLKIGDKVISNENSKIKIVGHDAFSIIPLSWDNTMKIKEVAFIDQYKIKNDTFLDLRIHVLENGQYVIYNKKLKCFGAGDFITYSICNNDKILDKFETGSSVAWFSILKLPIINNFDIHSPLGASVYGNSIDILKNIDDAFNTLCTEYRNGQKKVFYSKSMLNIDPNTGKPVTPDDENRTVFYYVGDDLIANSSNVDNNLPIKEFNPDLRIEEICRGINSGMNYLSSMCGLGNNFYNFDGSNVTKTATEVVSENSAMWRTIRKYEIALEKMLIDLFKSIIIVENTIHKSMYDENVNIAINFDTSIIEDKTKIRERALAEVNAGILSVEEYRAMYYADGRRDN